MKNAEFEDDRKVVANMNVPGMPWYDPRKATAQAGGKTESHPEPKKLLLSRKERFALFKAALCVLLPVILFFGAGYLLVMLFLHFVWLK